MFSEKETSAQVFCLYAVVQGEANEETISYAATRQRTQSILPFTTLSCTSVGVLQQGEPSFKMEK